MLGIQPKCFRCRETTRVHRADEFEFLFDAVTVVADKRNGKVATQDVGPVEGLPETSNRYVCFPKPPAGARKAVTVSSGSEKRSRR